MRAGGGPAPRRRAAARAGLLLVSGAALAAPFAVTERSARSGVPTTEGLPEGYAAAAREAVCGSGDYPDPSDPASIPGFAEPKRVAPDRPRQP